MAQRYLLLLAASLAIGTVLCYPDGSGACPAAKPAVGPPHLNKNGFTANTDLDLSDAPQNFTLTLNGEPLSLDGRGSTSFPINQAHTLELSSEGPFKGFLIRVGPQPSVSEFLTDFTEALAPSSSTDMKVELTHCVDIENVGGVTHTDSNDKTKVTAILQMDEPALDMIMDITVVIANTGETSEFYHTLLSLHAVDPADPKTDPNNPAGSSSADQCTMTTTLSGLCMGVASALLLLS